MDKTDEQRSDDYRAAVLQHLSEQTKSLDTLKTIAVLFTVLFVLGVIIGVLLAVNGSGS